MRKTTPAMAAAALACWTVLPAAAAGPKVTSIASLADLPTPLPYPYDENANADRQVDAALAKAKAQHKLAFLDLGGNWCGDCRVLAALLELPEVKAFVERHYVVAKVAMGRFNKNLQIPARWGIVDRLAGAPSVLIVDPDDNN